VARIVAFVPDLLFGSNVLGALSAAGHEATLAGDERRLAEQAPEADVLIVDLRRLQGTRARTEHAPRRSPSTRTSRPTCARSPKRPASTW
jgi:hypothetical protein